MDAAGTLLQIGAGNIGRSFVGALFSRAGWNLVFADTNGGLVRLLNERRYYDVVIKEDGREDRRCRIGPVRAIDARAGGLLAGEIAACDLLSVSVGKDALPKLVEPLAAALSERSVRGRPPLTVIIAENAPGAKAALETGVRGVLGGAFPLEQSLGLAETSIGKMVPLMKAEDLAADPLQLFAEAYETLIVDESAFFGAPPGVPGLKPVKNIAAWVDRKLFIHNLGHAAAAYLGRQADPAVVTIARALRLEGVERGVRAAMNAAADALALRYHESYSRGELAAHIDNLIVRFGNEALGDTVFRVGRGLARKLGPGDRLAGAMLFCARAGVGFSPIARVYCAALAWPSAPGEVFPEDDAFRAAYPLSPREAVHSPEFMFNVSGIDETGGAAVLRTLRELEPYQ